MIVNRDINSVSNIPNGKYFASHYFSYVKNNPNSKMIMIDLNSFKKINDTFGHNVGDAYLIYFSKLLLKTFNDSLVARLHGDEFAIVTTKSEEEIQELFNKCLEEIRLSVDNGELPRMFSFSAGSCDATKDIQSVSAKADCMMYYAKNHFITYQPFSEIIWTAKKEMDSFAIELGNKAKGHSFTYFEKQLYTKEGKKYPLKRIYTRDVDEKPIFDGAKYDYLRETTKLSEFDNYNFNFLLNTNFGDKDKRVVLIDHTTLINSLQFNELLKSNAHHSNSFIIGIDLMKINLADFNKLIQAINQLKEAGFEVFLDKVDTSMPDILWEVTNPEYVNFSSQLWHKALVDKKSEYILRHKLDFYSGGDYPSIPVFGMVTNKESYDYLKQISPDSVLFGGDYLEPEKKLVLK